MFIDGQALMTGQAFRHLFALSLQHTTLTNPLAIWEEFKEGFCDNQAHLLVKMLFWYQLEVKIGEKALPMTTDSFAFRSS